MSNRASAVFGQLETDCMKRFGELVIRNKPLLEYAFIKPENTSMVPTLSKEEGLKFPD